MFDVKALLTLILLVIPSWATAQYSRKYVELTTKADSLFMLGEYKAASHAFGEALQMTEFVQPQHRYNGACAAAKFEANMLIFNDLRLDWSTFGLQFSCILHVLHVDVS